MEEYKCKFCGKTCKNQNSLRNHERLCKNNPNHQSVKGGFEHYNELLKKKLVKRKPSNQFIKAREQGIEHFSISDETRLKLSISARSRRHTDKEKQHLSEVMSRIAKENPDKYSISQIHRRTKHFAYNGYRIDGTWELIVAKYLDSTKIRWEKCKKSFEYIWQDKVHLYYPDFYLPDFDRYIEVKGYETDRDKTKYKAVNNLILLKANEINLIKKGLFKLDIGS